MVKYFKVVTVTLQNVKHHLIHINEQLPVPTFTVWPSRVQSEAIRTLVAWRPCNIATNNLYFVCI